MLKRNVAVEPIANEHLGSVIERSRLQRLFLSSVLFDRKKHISRYLVDYIRNCYNFTITIDLFFYSKYRNLGVCYSSLGDFN